MSNKIHQLEALDECGYIPPAKAKGFCCDCKHSTMEGQKRSKIICKANRGAYVAKFGRCLMHSVVPIQYVPKTWSEYEQRV